MRLLPRSLFGRLVLVLLTGLVLAQLLSALVLLRDRGQALYQSVQSHLIMRTVGIVRLLDSVSPAERQRLLPLLSSADTRITLVRPTTGSEGMDSATSAAARLVRAQLVRHLPDIPTIEVSLEGGLISDGMPEMHRRHAMGRGMSGPWAYMHGMQTMVRVFDIRVQLRDGVWVRFERQVPDELFDWPATLLAILGILLVTVILLSLLAVRWSVNPLRRLRHAAEALGKDIHHEPLTINGPSEVAETANSFNTMQRRLQNYIEDRARILAAVSHDLKTPLTRLRLRSDLLENRELRSKIQNDLDDMESMVGATLDFMRGTGNKEPNQKLDLMALLESIQNNMNESGGRVELQGSVDKPYNGKPLALKRCVSNLVENAVRYGTQATISVEDGEQQVVVTIEDEGPGIPEEMLEEVFSPFYRLEASRSQHTGGSGLGLSIARSIARAHGGDVDLRNRPEGGLIARLTLPR